MAADRIPVNRLAPAVVALAVLLVTACAGEEDRISAPSNEPASREPGVLHVPGDHATIQDAVDEAIPGDLVLIEPGVYHETVIVETSEIVIRGVDRNEVIIDGEFDRENGIIVFSDGVAVENLTVRHNTQNGLFFTGDYDSDIVLRGYRASYVTAYDNGHYGIYGFNATHGLIEHSYGSGHPESAFYVGQCDPCDALVIDSVGEGNTFGYTGTNASHEVYLANNTFVDNRIGAAPHSGSHEELPPQRSAVLVGNVFADNNSSVNLLAHRTPDIDRFFPSGVGLWVRGGSDNLIARNFFADNLNAAVFVDVNIDTEEWISSGNRVRDNAITGSKFDLVLVVPDPSEGALGNCFAGNDAEATLPPDLETVAACGADATALTDVAWWESFDDLDEVDASYEDQPAPGPQPQMPDAATAPARPASTLPRLDNFDPDLITVPLAP